MGKIEIKEDCLVPDRFIYITYEGPDPWDVAKKLTGDSVKQFFHVSSSGTNEEIFKWDITGDNTTFFLKRWVRKKFSRFSGMEVRMKLQGHKAKANNKGKFTLQLTAYLNTKFTGWGVFVRPVWNIYSYLFYNRVRRMYLERCREFTVGFQQEIRRHYNLKVTAPPGRHTAYG